ncbi:hypothetical protein GCM10007908_12040 [Rhizobium albus]|nr:hypothetical protein GCM10007908_12040 [Rhizobium albus]
MATHPYISGAGNITQMINQLKRSFPATVNSDTVKKLGLAPNNESYVINVLQFLKIIDAEGKSTERGEDVLTTHDPVEFQKAFAELVKDAYSDLFDIHKDDAWELPKAKLINYFRKADRTSEIIGGRQAGVFQALSELAGYQPPGAAAARPKASAGPKPSSSVRARPVKKSPPPEMAISEVPATKEVEAGTKSQDMALTVRIEINLPSGETRETYDAIFKSIKENLYP